MIPSRQHFKPRIVVTMGDPCGVGPEVLVKALSSQDLLGECSPLVVGDPLSIQRALDLLGSPLSLHLMEELPDREAGLAPNRVNLIAPCRLSPEDIAYGNPTETTCRAVITYIRVATELAMDSLVDGMCTCPIHKAKLQGYGFPFPGHTEFLQSLTRARDVVMMLAGPRLRVSLVTIHNSIADIPKLLNRENIRRTILITAEALSKDFGMRFARIAVAGLNPHAGEQGHFGKEELEMIGPVVEQFHSERYKVSGPFPPDTLFHRAFEGEFDAVVAMYHDQGLIPIKLVHFHEAVNVSLGLPIIRTSVDHGTAYDLAGTGKAGAGSLKAALLLAGSMARNRSLHEQIIGGQ